MWRDLKVTCPFLVDVIGKATIGSSGAVTSQVGRGATIAKVTGAGKYTLTLDTKGGVADILFADFQLAHATNVYTVSITDINNTTGVITFTVAAGGTAADPASGVRLGYRVVVQNARYTG
jgi:hypothetical protein